MRELHLICNAHVDPIWLWNWEEGAGAAVSTFRTVADLCESFDGFVFNHNEALLYQWVEEYEPKLFKRIQRLVEAGRWHIMGGWYLQPDCNLPSGEAFVRQIIAGLDYFDDRFGVRPTTAVNFDSFGHTQGLVQILTRLGFRSYMHTRPRPDQITFSAEEYRWRGFDGSMLLVHREPAYNSRLGQAADHVQRWIEAHKEKDVVALLWGVGNHGGGPSRKDLHDLEELQRRSGGVQIAHSTPEAFFEKLDPETLPIVDQSLRPCFVGCYTSQTRIKQTYRQLENEVFLTEKVCAHASLAGRMDYPHQELDEALRDLLLAQFHDVIAGSSIQSAEEASLRMMHHGIEILSRVKARAFFAIANAEPPARDSEIPIFVYNPHPFPIEYIVDSEYQLRDVDREDVYYAPQITLGGVPIPNQAEREVSNVPVEFRKRVVFKATLPPAKLTRFSCAMTRLPCKPPLACPHGRLIEVNTGSAAMAIDTVTGFLERFAVGDADFLGGPAFVPAVFDDVDDSWGDRIERFNRKAGVFRVMSPEDASTFAAVTDSPFAPVRVIEDGPIRTVVQALLVYESSRICQTYYLPKTGSEVVIETRVYWAQQHQMLKLLLPTQLKKARLVGQTAFGSETLPNQGEEVVAQKWCAVVDSDGGRAVTCINDGSYGLDFEDGELRLSLLRSPAYSALPFQERKPVPDDRFSPRIDQGERVFRFWLNAGPVEDRLTRIDREALVHNEKPVVLSYFPAGDASPVRALASLDDDAVQIAAFKKAAHADEYIVRIFEPTGKTRTTTLRIPMLDIVTEIHLKPFDIKTYRLYPPSREMVDVNLSER